jgi:hypothetical protein
MPKNPFYADVIVLKDGGVVETAAGTDIISVSSAGVPSIKADIKEALAEGSIYIGDSAGVTSELTIATDKGILIGNGTTAVVRQMSSGATISNTGAVTLADAAVSGALITGFVSGAGAVADTDTILEAINKTDGNVVALQAIPVGGALPDGDMIVGNAGNVATGVTMTGDVTITNGGVTTVTASTGPFAVGTTFKTGNTTATSGPGAIAITGAIHEITTTGAGDAMTLADGAEGQHLYVVYVAEGAGGDTAVCTPTNLAGANTTITFTDLGDSAHLLFTAGNWYFLGGEATIA